MPNRRRFAWNDVQRRRLIAHIKQFEVIWQPGPSDQRMRRIRRNAFQQIQRHFVADGFSVDDVTAQWRNLRDVFYKRYDLMISRAQNGEDPARVKPCWIHFDDLRFLASPEAIGAGRGRRALSFGTIDMVERQIEQSLVLPYDGDGGDEDDETEELFWPKTCSDGDDGKSSEASAGQQEKEQPKIDPAAIVQQQLKMEDTAAAAAAQRKQANDRRDDGALIVEKDFGHHRQQQDVPQQLMMGAQEIGRHQMDPSSCSPSDSPMSRLGRSIDQRILSSAHPAHALNGQQESGGGAVNWSAGPSTSSSSAAATAIVEPLAKRRRGETGGIGHQQQQQDRFKHFGAFVESALRDLHQQSPELARRLMQGIYSTISAHQMEATGFGQWHSANSGI